MTPFSEPPAPELSVWIVEDDVGYRDTVAEVLDTTPGFACTGAFYDYEEVEALLAGPPSWARPEVVLLDINLPGRSGIQGLAHFKARVPEAHVVMLTVNDSADLIFDAFRSGACGYLLKDTPVADILQGIHDAHRGGMPMPPAVAAKVLAFFAGAGPRRDYDLTAREHEVLLLVADGLTHRQIADRLFLSPHTVENHLRSIYQKLHVSSGVQAVAKAFREGLIS